MGKTIWVSVYSYLYWYDNSDVSTCYTNTVFLKTIFLTFLSNETKFSTTYSNHVHSMRLLIFVLHQWEWDFICIVVKILKHFVLAKDFLFCHYRAEKYLQNCYFEGNEAVLLN